MKRSQWLIILSVSAVVAGWLFLSYQNLQALLRTPLSLPLSKQTPTSPLSTDINQMLLSEKSSFTIVKNNTLWGIVPKIDPIKPLDPNSVVFTPASSMKSARACVGMECFEFLGLVDKKALFYDTNASAVKKTVTLGSGATLHKPLRIKKITQDTVILVDTKTKTTYEMSLFKIDLAPYKPQSDSKKGK